MNIKKYDTGSNLATNNEYQSSDESSTSLIQLQDYCMNSE